MGLTLRSILIFFLLLVMQLLIFSHVDLLGYVNPAVYILWIGFFPFLGNRPIFLVSSFLLGWILDIYLNTGGVHAAGLVLLAFARPLLLRLAFGAAATLPGARINRMPTGEVVVFFGLAVVVHQLLVYALSIYDASRVIYVLRDALYGSILTFIIVMSLFVLFKPSRS